MEACRASFKVAQRLFCSLWFIENCEVGPSGFRRRFGDDPCKNRPDCCHAGMKRRCKIVGGRETKAERETPQSFRLVGNSVGLLFCLDLKAVLDAPEKEICVVQGPNFIA